MSSRASTETVDSLVRETARHETPTVQFVSGEALLDPRFSGIVKRCTDADLLISLGSNGILMTEEYLKKLKKSGLSRFGMSIHDGNAEGHDKIVRETGAFDAITNAIKIRKRLGMRPTLASVYSLKFEKKVPLSALNYLQRSKMYL